MDILASLAHGFSIALTPWNLLFLVVGGVVGTLVGAFPGLSAPTAIALLLPLTFSLDPTAAIIMLAGIYYASQFGGSITSVLIGVPGDPSAVVTAIEGHKLAKQGKAGHALTVAAVGSFVGSTIGAIILMFFAPVIAGFALEFGPPEYFALIILSFAVLPAFAGGGTTRMLLSLGVGLFIATVGLDDFSARPRFTFGTADLLSGVGFVPAVIGIYGIADVFYLAGERSGTNEKLQKFTFRSLFPPVSDWIEIRWAMLRSSIVGFLIGCLPGAGATIASFSAYALERNFADPKTFGKGNMMGLTAGETANNSAAIGAMVPMLTLGIPSSGSTAVMLGGFLIWGLQPGPLLFQHNPDFVWGLIASMYIGSVFLLVLNVAMVPFMARLMNVSPAVLAAIIVIFCAGATYSVNLNPLDLWVMLAFGVLGYFFRLVGIPETPLVLGLVLAPLLEGALRQSMTMSSGDPGIFLERPISATLLCIAFVMFIGLPIVKRLRKTKTSLVPEPQADSNV
jgi:putative tricarboxylic transport membrane protein